jgi:hypothetical protein
MTELAQTIWNDAISNPGFVDKLMSGDSTAKALFDSIARNMLGMPADSPPSPGAAEVLTSKDPGPLDWAAGHDKNYGSTLPA